MKKITLILFIFLSSCSSNITKSNIDFSKDMNFDEFKIQLDKYAKTNPYPNINN